MRDFMPAFISVFMQWFRYIFIFLVGVGVSCQLTAAESAASIANVANIIVAGDTQSKAGSTGRLKEEDLQLIFIQPRFYGPMIGRFYSNDPVGFTASNPMMFNRYAYANNNPYKYLDPNGENPAVAVSRSFQAGYSVGGKINSGITATLGKPLGVALYNAVNNQSANEKPSLVDEKGKEHILDGDGKGGGHRNGTGKPGKSEFPTDWSDEKILGEISDVATDPESTVEIQSDGRNISKGTRDGIDIKTVQEPASRGGRIVTGYPTNTPKNPKP